MYEDLFDREIDLNINRPLHPSETLVFDWVKDRVGHWRDDPKTIRQDVSDFSEKHRITATDTMSSAMRWVTNNHPLNSIVCRHTACQWTLAKLDTVTTHATMPRILESVTAALDTSFGYAAGQVETVDLAKTHVNVLRLMHVTRKKLTGRSDIESFETFVADTHPDRPRENRVKALLAWLSAVSACCDPQEFSGGDGIHHLLFRVFLGNVEFERCWSLAETRDLNKSALYTVNVCWGYFRELGFLLRVPQ